ncbi:tRNA (guanine(37)-N1)-methyltransferase [Vespula maculifrons]|uniref:tRNA (Guanine(37)-N1)-methyltransferase n=1 Tax=Vespula maculifrons TaxID=7453 RepID=A0ABD2CPI6_VESMC
MVKNLKKLDLKVNETTTKKTTLTRTKDKMAYIDKQMKELHQEVCRSVPKKKSNIGKVQKQANKKIIRSVMPVQTDATATLVEQMQI